MIDGSHLNFEDNIELTRKVVAMSNPTGIPVEAELGKVGGKEDDLDGGSGGYTEPHMAKEFVERTAISSLAVAIGTAHGIYTEIPKLDIGRLKAIRNVVDVPLVLHGASGLTKEQICECIDHGICKVNFATELRRAYKSGLGSLISEKPDAFDPKTYGAAGRDSVKQFVKNIMSLCGSVRIVEG
jgi:tagatose 1,6-diphosphate aldolase GatY/KbaY